jgi:hypothetical protein
MRFYRINGGIVSRVLSGRLVGASVAVGMAAASLIALAAPASAAPAYNFPFHGECGADAYYDAPSVTKAIYDHRDGNVLWYRIYWGISPVDPDNPLSPSNWSSCTV